MNALITNPRAHRAAWARKNPQAMVEHGGIVSAEDLDRWACDLCMAALDPDKPIKVVGGPEGYSVCEKCARKHDASPFEPCTCEGCVTIKL